MKCNKSVTISDPLDVNSSLASKLDRLSLNLIELANMKMEFQRKYYETKISSNKSLRDFDLYQCIGKGAFAAVYLAADKSPEDDDNNEAEDADEEKQLRGDDNRQIYAIKIQNKQRVIKEQQIEHVKSEKKLLSCTDNPFIIRLVHSFQDRINLYLAMEFMPGGELFRFLRIRMYFGEETAKFYSMQILLAIEYLHRLDIVYRDLKPENILINSSGYLKLADFGFAKMLFDNRTYTLCGTPEYLAPEIILHRGYGPSVDWWAIGIFIFELLAGHTPFCSSTPKHIYEKILLCKIKFPAHISNDAKSLIRKLIEPDVSKRLGNLKRRSDDVKGHKWFETNNKVNWNVIYNQSMKLPIEIASYKIKSRPELYEDFRTHVDDLLPSVMIESDDSRNIFIDF